VVCCRYDYQLRGQQVNSYREYLIEKISPIVYHFTGVNSLRNILVSNEFITTSVLGTGADSGINNGKFFFLSTTRSRNQGYNNGDAKIVLRGDLLNRRYSGCGVDYWGYDFRKSGCRPEMEDRIVTDHSSIANANQYISEIHIFVGRYSWVPPKSYVDQIVAKCQEYNIPIYFYNERKYFDHQYKEGSIPVDEVPTDDREFNASKKYYQTSLIALLCWRSPENRALFAERIDQSEIIDEIDDKISKINYSLGQPWSDEYTAKDRARVFDADLHNIRASSAPEDRFLLKMYASELRKFRVNDIREYILTKMKKAE